MNQAGQMIQGANGQQIMVHAVPQGAQAIQVATQGGQALQQIQVVPVSNLQVCMKLLPQVIFCVFVIYSYNIPLFKIILNCILYMKLTFCREVQHNK